MNIAEGSTGQTDAELARFLGYALRSLVETVACLHIIRRRGYITEQSAVEGLYSAADALAARIQCFRKKVAPGQPWVSEPYGSPYDM